jgi:hypothetical protein
VLADALAGEDADAVPPRDGGDEPDRRVGGGGAVAVPEDPPPELLDEEPVTIGTLVLKPGMVTPRALSAAVVEIPTTGSAAMACT